jgi:hypothetical protein
MTDQSDIDRPTTYHAASAACSCSGDARARHEELTMRDAGVRARATVVARGDHDPARHGSQEYEPLTVEEYLEILATGEAVARTCRHLVEVGRALAAGVTWAQVAAARGCPQAQARQEYRDWAEGQHNLWRGGYSEGGRFGIDDAGGATAIARAYGPDPGGAKACAATHRVLCAHAGDGQHAHWLAPGQRCTRGRAGLGARPG